MKLQGKLVAGLTMVAFFGVLGSAHAQGQSPYAAPAQSPYAAPAQSPYAAPAQPPVMEAQPPMVQAQPQWAPPPPMVQAAPPMLPPPPMAAAPNGPNDMTGSLGFGVGVEAGTDLVRPGANIYMRYWFNDSLSILPSLQFKLFKQKDIDMQWAVAPSTQLVYCPWKTASTRFAIGGGIGMSFDKWAAKGPDGQRPDLGSQPGLGSQPPPNVTVYIYLPISAGVEHFFARWFSMGVLVTDRLVEYGKNGDKWALAASIDNTKSLAMVGFLFFYTD